MGTGLRVERKSKIQSEPGKLNMYGHAVNKFGKSNVYGHW